MMNPAVQYASARASLRTIHHVSPSASTVPPSPRTTRRRVASSDASNSRAATCGNASRITPMPISPSALAANSSAAARCVPERPGPFVPSAMSVILPSVSIQPRGLREPQLQCCQALSRPPLVPRLPLELEDLRERSLDRSLLDRQLVELAGEAERHLVVAVVDRGARVDADVEGLVLREHERQRLRNLLRIDHLAVHLQRAAAAEPEADAVVLEVEDERVLARRERVLSLPAEPLDVDVVVDEHRLALEEIEADAAEPPAVGHEHPFGAALGNLDLGGDRVGAVEEARRAALRRVRELAGVDEPGAPAARARLRLE